jgi:hypothetical protein
MKLITTYREIGQTRATVSGSTVVGALFGNKASAKAVERAIFNTNQRTLRRKHQVWVCGDRNCVKAVSSAAKPNESIGALVGTVLVIGAVILALALADGGDDSEATKTATSPAAAEKAALVNPVREDGATTDTDYAVPPSMTAVGSDADPRPRPQGTCYLKPGSKNVVVTDWDDKMACAVELGLAPR